MAISLVGRKTFGAPGTIASPVISLTDLTGGSDTAPSTGDFIIVHYSIATASADLAVGAATGGYTEQTELFANDSSGTNLAIYTKFAGGTPDTSITLTPPGNSQYAYSGTIWVLRGVDATTPMDVAVATATGTNSALANPPSITPTTSGAWVFGFGSAAEDSLSTAFTSSDLTDFISDLQVDTNDSVSGSGYIQWTSGAVDPAAFSITGGSTLASWAAVTMAIRPAATAGAISGSTTLTFSNSGALTGAGALSGALTTAFTTAGILKGAGALSGSTALTFSTSATGRLVAAASGSTSLTFSTSGALTGAGALSGALALAFTPSGTLTGAGALAGSSSVTFTPTGALVGSGALSGSTTLAFTTSGNLEGQQASGASSSFSFTASGTLTGSGALSGSASFAFTASASLGGSGALAGSTSLTFDASGVLTGEAVEPEPEAPRGGAWVETREARQARREYASKRREAWKRLEQDLEDAYAEATGQPRKSVRPAVREALAPRDPQRVKAIAERLVSSGQAEAVELAQRIEARLAEIAELAAMVAQAEQIAAQQRAMDEEDAIIALLLAA
jgi:hypothetical protein